MAGNPHIEEKHSAQMSVGAKMLRFPETVGMGPAFSTSAQTGGTVREAKPGQFPGTIDNRTYEFNWNSDEYSEQRGQTIDHRAHEPYVMFEFLSLPPDMGFNDWHFNGFAQRVPKGSVSMYMPSDVQINDTMQYNEDSRKMAAAAKQLISGSGERGAGLTESGALHLEKILAGGVLVGMEKLAKLAAKKVAAAATGGPKVSGLTKLLGNDMTSKVAALGTYGIGDIVANEYMLSTGKVQNPNEYINYQKTPLRTFAFNFKMLPASLKESESSIDIIKMFRRAAHSKRRDAMTVLVPDHIVISFHGQQGMIQIPPVVITTCNVSYNPNSVSMFKRGNRPVEIDLSLTMQEIFPIHQNDVEELGY
jgi:hypothetical protein